MTHHIAVLPFPVQGLSIGELRISQDDQDGLIAVGGDSMPGRPQTMGEALLAAKVATVIAEHLRGEVFTRLELITDMLVDRVCDQAATTDDDLRLAAVAFRTLSDQINGYLSMRSAEKRLSVRVEKAAG